MPGLPINKVNTSLIHRKCIGHTVKDATIAKESLSEKRSWYYNKVKRTSNIAHAFYMVRDCLEAFHASMRDVREVGGW